MEQIYYTQCPMGYGLGVSNGFQIKRRSQEYPVSGDFRHLGLRAFLPGTKTLAPPALRYRRDGETAELAWLTPRTQEYETERGLWGRPGGHFAHGLRLTPAELSRLARWPAGLYDGAFWKRSDPLPSKMQPPDDLALSRADLMAEPTFLGVAPLAAGLDPRRLAWLLSALAGAVREGRSLFLIAEPDRLGPLAALLTFAFPEPMRLALTFSTYHDRPEELPGFRLQGTIPAARPNRTALLSLGSVADLTTDQFHPPREPAPWARTLADWFVQGNAAAARAWSDLGQLAAQAQGPAEPESIWHDSWLDRLVAFQGATDPPIAPPTQSDGWADLADLAPWAFRSGLGGRWASARSVDWWQGFAWTDAAWKALVAHAQGAEVWLGPDPAAVGRGWGEVVASRFTGAGSESRLEGISRVLKAAPAGARPGFLTGLVKALPAPMADEVLDRFRGRVDPTILLPLEARGAVASALELDDPKAFKDLLARAFESPRSLAAVLDAVADAATRPATRAWLAQFWADAFEQAQPPGQDEALRWALMRQELGRAWVEPLLRRIFGVPHHEDAWGEFRDRTPPDLRPMLARAVLQVVQDSTLPTEAFRWGVEALLLTIPEPLRPHDPTWPDLFLKRTPSVHNLSRRLFIKESSNPALKSWLAGARARGEISREQLTHIENTKAYARSRKARDSHQLKAVDLSGVPSRDRPALMDDFLSEVGSSSIEKLIPCLDSFRYDWPGAFAPGAEGLADFAQPLARALAPHRPNSDLWFQHLGTILSHLGLTGPDGQGFEPNSLASEIVAATIRLPARGLWPFWDFRKALLDRESSWRILTVDARADLFEVEPSQAPEVVKYWDENLEKTHTTARFFELMLNACDERRLGTIVPECAASLRSLGPLHWWAAPLFPDATPDLRERFARQTPLAPLPQGRLTPVQTWMQAPSGSRPGAGLDPPDLVPLEGESISRAGSRKADLAYLSPLALARWTCIEELTRFRASMNRWDVLDRWIKDSLPLDLLSPDDRQRFVSWTIFALDDYHEIQHQIRVWKWAKWLVKVGAGDHDQISSWDSSWNGSSSVPSDILHARRELVSELVSELRRLLLESRGPSSSPSPDRPS